MSSAYDLFGEDIYNDKTNFDIITGASDTFNTYVDNLHSALNSRAGSGETDEDLGHFIVEMEADETDNEGEDNEGIDSGYIIEVGGDDLDELDNFGDEIVVYY